MTSGPQAREAGDQSLPRHLPSLSARELEVLSLIGRGLSMGEIARALHRSIPTIKSHRRTLAKKLGLHRRVDLAKAAIRAGLATVQAEGGDEPDAVCGRPPWMMHSSGWCQGLPFAVVSPERVTTFCTDTFASLLGPAAEGLLDRAIECAIDESSRSALAAAFEAAAAGHPASAPVRVVGAPGGRGITVHGVFDDVGRIEAYTLTLMDLTALKAKREQLESAWQIASVQAASRQVELGATAELLRLEMQRRAGIESALHELDAGTTPGSGQTLPQLIVRHLARSLGMHATILVELAPDNRNLVMPIAAWANDRLVTVTPEDLAGGPCEALISGGCTRHFPSALAELFPESACVRRFCGESYLGTVLRSSEGSPIGILGVLDNKPMPSTDLAMPILRIFASRAAAELERARIERAKRRVESHFAALVRLAPIGLFLTNEKGGCTYVNEQCCELTGRTPESLYGDGWLCIVHPDDRERVHTEWLALVRTHRYEPCEFRLVRPDGTELRVFGQACPERDEAGWITGYAGVLICVENMPKTVDRVVAGQRA